LTGGSTFWLLIVASALLTPSSLALSFLLGPLFFLRLQTVHPPSII
jgi:hypothetical protein